MICPPTLTHHPTSKAAYALFWRAYINAAAKPDTTIPCRMSVAVCRFGTGMFSQCLTSSCVDICELCLCGAFAGTFKPPSIYYKFVDSNSVLKSRS